MSKQVVWVFVYSQPLITEVLGVFDDPNKVLSSEKYKHIPLEKGRIIMEDDTEMDYWSYVIDDWTLKSKYWCLEPCYVE